MLKKDRRSINNNYIKKQIILVAIISIYMLSLSFISARYAVKKVNSFVSSSKEFYFYSDKLSDEEIVYPINWSGTGECVIPISLYTKLNNLKVSNHDVKYKVEYELLSSNASCTLTKEEGVVPYINNKDSFSIIITPNGVIEKNEKIQVKVKVSTIDDFEKELTAKFILVANDELLYKIEDKSGRAYLNLILNNNTDKYKKVTLSFEQDNLIIDTTNDIFNNLNSYKLINGTKYINKITFTLDPVSNINIRFFKQDRSQNYTNDNQIVNCEFEEI